MIIWSLFVTVACRLSLGRSGGRRLERNLDAGCIAHIPLTFLEPDLEVGAVTDIIVGGGRTHVLLTLVV